MEAGVLQRVLAGPRARPQGGRPQNRFPVRVCVHSLWDNSTHGDWPQPTAQVTPSRPSGGCGSGWRRWPEAELEAEGFAGLGPAVLGNVRSCDRCATPRVSARFGRHRSRHQVERHYAHTDLNEALRTIKTNSSRKSSDITREAERGNRKLGYQEQDVRTQAGRSSSDLQTRSDRALADFHTQLATIARKFGDLGKRPGEAANAAGVNDAGTQAASAAARQRNQTFAPPARPGRSARAHRKAVASEATSPNRAGWSRSAA